jgi:opacity protein-like surface antigen
MRDGLWATTAIALALGGSASAADVQETPMDVTKPAVSGFNGKLEFGYLHLNADGSDDGDGAYGVGSFSMPVAERFGIQIDAGLAKVDTNADFTIGGVGAHAFWRNPDVALLGGYAHYVRASSDIGSANAFRLGGEGELYLDRFSVEGFAGADIVDGSNDNDAFFTGNLIAAFYPTDNIRVHAGVSHSFEETFGRVGAEAMLPFAANNVALFGDARIGDDVQDYRVGLKLYFGESGKSLIARHREDDPKEQLLDFFKLGGTPPVVVPEEPGGCEEEVCSGPT